MSLRKVVRKMVTEIALEQKKVSYSAVVLDETSRKKVLHLLKDVIPADWKIITHHMTICMGELPEEYRPFIGHSVDLSVTGIGLSDKALALRVEGFDSNKKVPHVTVAINEKSGGKPKDSNDIERWADFGGTLTLRGKVEEVEFPTKDSQELNESMSIRDINELPFKDAVLQAGGEIYSVGGAVRDGFLGKESKDLDVLIAKIPIDKLIKLLQPFSDKIVKEVGESYGVIKFVPRGSKEEIDIAIPRTENKKSAGHTGFEFSPDHNLPVDKELGRRDFTINAIAKGHDGKIIDPFNGIEDLKNKVIRVIGEKSFSDDPLRMLRAVQFASRFGFKIEPRTLAMIKENAALIKEISSERFLIEFDKMVTKGNLVTGIELLDTLNLFKYIFGFNFLGDYKSFAKAKCMADFIFLCYKGQNLKPSVDFKEKFKGGTEDLGINKIVKQLQALEMLSNITEIEQRDRLVVSRMLAKTPLITESGLLNGYVKSIVSDFESGKYPKSLGGLAVNGNDLMAMGLEGEQIGLMLNKIYIAVLHDTLKNDKTDIIEFVQKPVEPLKEEQKKGKVTKLTFFDFDGTLADSPTPENGKQKYKEVTGNEYPHQGWWGKPESLTTFDVKAHPSTIKFYDAAKSNPNNRSILLTNRIPKLANIVKDILAKMNLQFDEYSFKAGRDEKPQRIEKFLHQYPDVTEVEVHDDQDDQLVPLAQWANKMEKTHPGLTVVIYDAKEHIFKK